MNYKTDIAIKEFKIRHRLDDKSGEFYYSIVDVIDNLGLSTDPRNYWKVLKSRLKNTQKELVTNCNQLKMASSDGKNYLTDVATASTMLQIIELISPTKLATFSQFFDQKEYQNRTGKIAEEDEEKKISTDFFDEGEIQVDISFSGENYILVKAMLAGVNPSDIFISVGYQTITIKSNRVRPSKIENENFYLQELFWGKFSKVVELPYEVDIDKVEATSNHGLLNIKLFILDKERTKIVKVKSM